MSQKDYRCNCNKCNHEFISHESPTNCTECGEKTQQCVKI